MTYVVRRVGIAIGSVMIAWLAASLVVGVLLGPDVVQRPGMAMITLVLGGLIYRDIVRREGPDLGRRHHALERDDPDQPTVPKVARPAGR
jgi:hypothetical protein